MSQWKTCPNCRRRGQIPDPDPEYKGRDPAWITCPTCEGSGQIEKSDKVAAEPSAKHSPGPWTIVVPKHPLHGFTHAITSPIGAVAWAFPPNDDEAACEANARLIAAAPQLLATCELVRDMLESGRDGAKGDALVVLRGVIEKATGTS